MSDSRSGATDSDRVLLLAGWLRFHDRDTGGPKNFASPLGRLIQHSADDRRGWEVERPRARPPIGEQVDVCMQAARLVSVAVAGARCTSDMRDSLWLMSAVAWLSPDGVSRQWRDNGELCGYLASNSERVASRLPVRDVDRLGRVWSFGELEGDALRRRIRSRQKTAARLQETLRQLIQRQGLGR